MSNFSLTIDGTQVAAAKTFGVINPATGVVFEHAPECSADQLDLAFAAAQRAFTSWRKDEAQRRACMVDAANLLMASVNDIAPVLTTEQGKPLVNAQIEVYASAMWLQHYAAMPIPHDLLQDDELARVEVVRRPLGVVAGITPWNFPLVLAFWKIAPALLAGNTMVLKPSPFTPLATLKTVEILQSVLPPGVLNAVSGGDGLGALMTSHPVPRKISFTGSTATGKLVAASAAPDLKRITLELGGNDPAIVLDDANPQVVANAIFEHAFDNNGQVCSAIKRVYVPEALYDDVVDALAEKANAVVVGDGSDPASQLGPINNAPQFERVKMLVADALSSGASAVTGGHALDGPGYFFAPTILANINEGTRIVDEEQFGPALPVLSYKSIDEAIERANATNFGLSGSVWGTDSDRAAEVANQLDCGTTWVNTHLQLGPSQPFGGHKWSGIGIENGTWGLDAFTEVQAIHRSKVPLA